MADRTTQKISGSVDTRARPFVKWVGGKRQLTTELLARVPNSFNRYFEPMVGGGALFFALGPQKAVLADVNEELVNAYRVIQTDVRKLIRNLKQHRHEKEYYYTLREADRLPSYRRWGAVRRASRLICLNKTCFNGLYRVNSKGFFNTPFGDYNNPTIVDKENLLRCHEELQGANIELGSFTESIRSIEKDDFVYFDPPYAPLSATSNFTSYNKDGFSNQMQTELRDTCLKLDRKGVRFMLSNSSAPLILDLYKDFNISFVEATRQVNSKASKRGKIKEVIVTNY